MSSAFSHEDMVDKLFEVRGIDSVCSVIIRLPEDIKAYVAAQKGAK